MTTGPVVVVLGPAAVRDGRTTSCGAGYNDAVGVPFLLVAVTAFRVRRCLPAFEPVARSPRRVLVDRRARRSSSRQQRSQIFEWPPSSGWPGKSARASASERAARRSACMDRAGAVTYEEDPYLPDCKGGEEESPAYDSGQDLGQVGATDPTLDDEGRSLLRLAAGEELEELHHGERLTTSRGHDGPFIASSCLHR